MMSPRKADSGPDGFKSQGDGRVSRAPGKLRFALALLREAGVLALFGEFIRRLAGRRTLLLLNLDLDTPPDPARFPPGFAFGPATPEEVRSTLADTSAEPRHARLLLLMRRYFHESGLTDCYVVRHVASGDVCHIRWLVTRESATRASPELARRFATLADDEGRAEYTFTATRFRHQGLAAAAGQAVLGVAFERGVRRMIAHVDRRNLASLATAKRQGYRVTAVIVESRFLGYQWQRVRPGRPAPAGRR